MHNRKVAMIVLNPIVRDARVNKEAVSLTRAGFNVTVIGIEDNNNPPCDEVTADGFRMIRLPKDPLAAATVTKYSILRNALISLVIAIVLTSFFLVPTMLVPDSLRFNLTIVLFAILLFFASNLWLSRSVIRRVLKASYHKAYEITDTRLTIFGKAG